MARPKRLRVDYFSFDVDFFEDEKIEPISGEFGSKGEIVAIKLLCVIYRNGYFINWNEQLKMTLSNRCKVSHDLINQIILRLVKYDFFDNNLFENEKVITSKAIQRRFKEATRKRKIEYENLDFWLISDENEVSGGTNEVSGGRNTPESEFKASETPQSKSKVNNNTNVLLKKNTQKKDLVCVSENLNEEETPSSTSLKNFEKEKEKSSAKKEKELEDLKNFLIEKGADDQDVSEWFKKRIEENKPTKRYFVEKFTLECKKNNISVKDAVYACAFNGWVNFNPQWILNQQNSNSKTSKNGESNHGVKSLQDNRISGRENKLTVESFAGITKNPFDID